MRRWIVTSALLLSLVAAVPRARAEGNYAADAGIGTACVFVNLLYMPAKFVYATLGGITGGFAYLLTGLNYDVADRIWAPSLGGNYVVTPAHLRNQETLYFSGAVQEDQP
ncbi:MAG: hypothetical protein HYY35_08330 [Deltaproteobacteria bacterium]|nr:hypothetical protein [Deltaproteobacteria bacterium]